MKKVYGSAAEALDGVLTDGMTIAAGGFGLARGFLVVSIPAAIAERRVVVRYNTAASWTRCLAAGRARPPKWLEFTISRVSSSLSAAGASTFFFETLNFRIIKFAF